MNFIRVVSLIAWILLLYSCNKFKKAKSFYKDGKIKQEVDLDNNGKSHGLLINYFNNGTISGKINFVHGEQEGLAYFYDSLGRLKYQSQFLKSKLDGKEIKYFENGRTECKTYYKSGLRYDFDTCYYPTGEILYISKHDKDGDPIELNYFTKKGLNDIKTIYGEKFDVMYEILADGSLKPFKYYIRIENNDKLRNFLNLADDKFEYSGNLDFLTKEDSIQIEKFYPNWKTKLKRVDPIELREIP